MIKHLRSYHYLTKPACNTDGYVSVRQVCYYSNLEDSNCEECLKITLELYTTKEYDSQIFRDRLNRHFESVKFKKDFNTLIR